VPCFDAASDHCDGWAPSRGTPPRRDARSERAPTRPGFDGGGKGSNPARRDHPNPIHHRLRPCVCAGRAPEPRATPPVRDGAALCGVPCALPPFVHGKDRDSEADR
jgi:hypothetical protein